MSPTWKFTTSSNLWAALFSRPADRANFPPVGSSSTCKRRIALR